MQLAHNDALSKGSSASLRTTTGVRVLRRAHALTAASLVMVFPAMARGAPDNATILYHADLDGRLASPRCGRGPERGTDFAALVGLVAAERARSPDAEPPPRLILLGGNQAGPDLYARNLLAEGQAGAQRLAALLARGSYDAVALGHHELSLPKPELLALVRALTGLGLPVVATNLRCTGDRQPLCSMIRSDLLVRRGPRAFGVLATIAPSVLAGVPPDQRAGLVLDDPIPAVKAAARRLRALGATDVVLMTQQNRGTSALAEIDALARALGAKDGPDLILAGGLWDEPDAGAVHLLAREGRVPIAGSGTGTDGLTRVTLSGPAPSRPSVAFVAAAGAPSDPETARLLEAEVPAFCARFGVAIARGPIRGTLTRDAFSGYVLDVARRQARAEIAILNRGFVKRAPFPLAGVLTRADLYEALPYRAPLGVARMSGVAVEKALAPLLGKARAVVAGLAIVGGKLQVNGRPLDKTRSYEVATIEFVAQGGDDLVAAGAMPWRPVPDHVDVRDAVEQFLRDDAGEADGDPGIDPRTDFGPPAAARPLVVGMTDVGFDLIDTTIANGPQYSDAQLARAGQTSLKGDLTMIAQLRAPAHQADGRFNVKYGWNRSKPPGEAAVSGETADLVTLTALYGYAGLKNMAARRRALIPDPYVRGWLESELTRPEVTATQSRSYHHLEVTGTAGALFTIASKLKLRAGAGARSELLAPGDDGRWRPLFEAGAALDPIALGSVGTVASRFEGLADYLFVDPSGAREHQLRASMKLAVPIAPLLFLAAGLDVFAVRRADLGWGVSYDTTVGLRIHLDAAHQAL